MTGNPDYTGVPEIHEANFRTACLFAKDGHTSTVLFTGKGEPTLFPRQIDQYLDLLAPYNFSFIELQTNGLRLADEWGNPHTLPMETLERWREKRLSTIALSVVGVDREANARIYTPDYPDLAKTIKYLRSLDFTVRLSVMMMYGLGCVSNVLGVKRVLEFCKANDVAQCTVRPLRAPENTHDMGASDFVREHGVTDHQVRLIQEWVKANGTKILPLSHGANVYDVDGQNLCLTDCLTPAEPDRIRTLIFYPNGKLTYDWQYPGAVLLSGRPNT
jgi:MoaA/NifB/PqqE/SkfB family radical SAM enzyme